MSAAQTNTAFGRIFPPREDWLAKAPAEPVIDPELPIIDTHHHLWQRTGGARGESWEVPSFRYLLHEFLADCASGHNVIGSVFLQCHSMYRATGPEQMRPVGETEFVAGIAAMSGCGTRRGMTPTR
jgi:L-fuconolactonase